MAPHDLQQILVTEYDVGAGIGWHRDKGEFELSLGPSRSESEHSVRPADALRCSITLRNLR
jgi:hypothetical protein